MNEQDKPIGRRFSHVYLQRGAPEKDSIRFRRRLGAFFQENLTEDRYDVATILRRELGVEIPFIMNYGYNISSFFEGAELRDVLDSVTVIFKYLSKKFITKDRESPAYWRQFVQRVFIEENLGYRLDEEAGVHFFVDEEFERNRLSALSCLAETKYSAVRVEFEKAHRKLDSDPPETKEAIRAVFEAVEILYKLIINAEGKTRLSSAGIRDKLKPLAQNVYKDDITACTTVDHLLDSLCNWIDACHMYRHGQKVEEPNDPPIELAVEVVSGGASYLRWLVELNSKTGKI